MARHLRESVVSEKPHGGPGRPEKPDREKRINVLRIRLNDAEREVLDAAAESQALDVSVWARAVLIREARRLKSPPRS